MNSVTMHTKELATCVALCWLTAPILAQTPVLEQAAVTSEGPHVFHTEKGAIVVKWIENGEVQEKRFAAKTPVVVPRFRDLFGKQLEIAKHAPRKSVWKMPKRLLAISDVEGEYGR
ncbi:MAG: hypothetical protein AAF404_19690, partial [Pseudomonadota bacterium]